LILSNLSFFSALAIRNIRDGKFCRNSQ